MSLNVGEIKVVKLKHSGLYAASVVWWTAGGEWTSQDAIGKNREAALRLLTTEIIKRLAAE